jgi:peptidoglycan/LPS O-acetylase OafA/YrhL
MIFVYHSHLYDWDFHLVGAFVVAIFFFMSGYGLETKRTMGAEFINKSFLLNALKKLLLPLLVPIIVYLFLRLSNTSFEVIIDEDIKKYQIILPFTWFVVTLIILYLFFYIAVAISKRIESKVNIFIYSIILEIILFNLLGRFIGVPGYASVTTTAFIAGILYKNYEKGIVNGCNRHALGFTIILSTVMLLLTVYIQAHVFGNFDRPLTAFVWSLCFMVLYAVIPAYNPSSWFGGFVSFLASISYELYICQSIVFVLLGEKNQYYPIVYLLSLFFLCTVVAFGCRYLTGKIFAVSAR